MIRKKSVKRPGLNVEPLEARHLQSGLAASLPQTQTAESLPSIEQENLRINVGQPPRISGETQIIAILIG